MLKELGELRENWVQSVLELRNWSKRKVTAGKVEPAKKFLEEEKVKMVKGKSRQLLLLLLQVFSFLYSSYIEVNQKKCLPKFIFPSGFLVTFTAKHCSNLEKCEDLFNVIIFLYLSVKKNELGFP